MNRTRGIALILVGLAVAAYGLPSEVDGSDGWIAARAYMANPARPLERSPAASTPVVVTVAARPAEVSAPPLPVAIPAGEALARELQKELRRVGCYDGAIDGAWTPAAQRAMQAFTERLNATLPVDAPDPVLYALLQGQHEQVCGRPCPGGQVATEAGRCLPAAIVARLAATTATPTVESAAQRTGPAPAVAGWITAKRAAAPAPGLRPKAPPEAHVALADPKAHARQEVEASHAVPRSVALSAGNRARAESRRRLRVAGRHRGERTASSAPRKAMLVRSVYRHLDWSL